MENIDSEKVDFEVLTNAKRHDKIYKLSPMTPGKRGTSVDGRRRWSRREPEPDIEN